MKVSSTAQVLLTTIHDSVGTLTYSLAELKRALLRSEKAFAQDVLQPLKQALLDGNTPNFAALTTRASQCNIEIETACGKRRDAVKATCFDIQGAKPSAYIPETTLTVRSDSEGYGEAKKLSDQVGDLEKQASNMGFIVWKDEEYVALKSDMFTRVGGPQSVTAYLDDWLGKHLAEPGKTDMGHLKASRC